MTTLREAATQALEALEDFGMKYYENTGEVLHRDVYESLKSALAEEALQRLTDVSQEIEAALAEPIEPVAWRFEARHIDSAWAAAVTLKHPGPEGVYMRNVVPLYTASPQRLPLTEEEIDELAMDEDGLPNSHLEFARAVERAHGIKE